MAELILSNLPACLGTPLGLPTGGLATERPSHCPCFPHLTPPQALQAGLAELRGWVAYVGGEWCCGPEEAEAAIERVTQAARFLVQVRAAGAWRLAAGNGGWQMCNSSWQLSAGRCVGMDSGSQPCCGVGLDRLHTSAQAARDTAVTQRHMPAYLHPAWPNPSIAHLLFHCQGKDDCIRKAYRGVDIVADLARSCPALSLQQV